MVILSPFPQNEVRSSIDVAQAPGPLPLGRSISDPVTTWERKLLEPLLAPLTLKNLLPLERTPSESSASHVSLEGEPLVVCVLVITASEGEALQVDTLPGKSQQGLLGTILIEGGALPDPATFYQEHPAGYGGKSLVFAVEQTALDPTAEPKKLLYVCIGAGSSERSLLCVVSKVPLFEFHYRALEQLRAMSSSDFGTFVQRLVDTSTSCLPDGNELVGGSSLPVMLAGAGASWSTTDRAGQRMVATWALGHILEESPHIVSEMLVTLLALVLQENRLLLLGEASFVNWLALLLRSLLQPYEWLHLFLPAALPLAGDAAPCRQPLEENPTPMIITMPQLPSDYASCGKLPEGLVPVWVGSLGLAFAQTVAASPERRGSKAPRQRLRLCFPQPTMVEGMHAHRLAGHDECTSKLKGVTDRLQQGSLGHEQAVKAIHQALQVEVQASVTLVRRYAVHHLERSQGETLASLHTRICKPDMFMQWLPLSRRSRRRNGGFYEAHFQTQMALDFLYRELESRMSSA